MSESTNQEDIEIRFLNNLHEIKLEIKELKSVLVNNQMQIKLAIADHSNSCMKCDQCVKKSELDRDLDGYFNRKQKKFIGTVEFVKSLITAGTILTGIWYLKK